jgi:hypothetical protein
MQYYTPKIKEFHVGFEYESFEIPLSPSFAFESKPPEWVKRKVLDINNSEHNGRALYHVSINNRYEENVDWNKNIRVKVLDKEDIEECGFKHVKDNQYIFVKGYYDDEDDLTGTEYQLTYSGNYLTVEAYVINYGKPSMPYKGRDCIFLGKLKNKSEFKKLLSQLEITYNG